MSKTLPRPISQNVVDLPHVDPSLKGGGGDGTYEDMEPRVRQLETDMAYIKGKLEDMPTKDWMTTRLIWVLGAFVVISGVIQVIIEKI